MLKEKYPIIELCRTLKCSKSGYYDWIKLGRPEIKKYDSLCNDLVMKMYEENKTRGIRRIRMEIKKSIRNDCDELYRIPLYEIEWRSIYNT